MLSVYGTRRKCSADAFCPGRRRRRRRRRIWARVSHFVRVLLGRTRRQHRVYVLVRVRA